MSTASFLNWIVQGSALTSLVWVGLRLARATNAATRYVIWWTTLATVMALPAAPWMSGRSLASQAGSAGASRLTAVPAWSRQFAINVPAFPEGLGTPLMIAWLVIVAVMGIRFLGGLATIRSIKRSSKPLGSPYEERLIVWKTLRGHGRTVRLALSDRVAIPSVLGLGCALIVLPESILSEVSDEELDQIVVHEHAHVQRYDDWAALIQLFIRMLLGFHPAVHWIHRELSLEREAACDDWVVTLTGARSTYARLLTRLVGEPDRHRHLALSPGVARCRPAITLRVMRLLDRQRNRSIRLTAAAPVATAVMVIMTLGLSNLTPLLVSEIASVSTLEASRVVPFMNGPTAPPGDVARRTLALRERPAAPRPMRKRLVSLVEPQRNVGDVDAPSASIVAPLIAAPVIAAPVIAAPVIAAPVIAAPVIAAPLIAAPLIATPLATATIPRTELPETLLPRPLNIDSRTVSTQTQDRAPWEVGADAGVAAGNRATAAGRAMAGVFSRFAFSVAGRF